MGGGSPLEGGEALGLSASLWGEQVISYVGSGDRANPGRSPGVSPAQDGGIPRFCGRMSAWQPPLARVGSRAWTTRRAWSCRCRRARRSARWRSARCERPLAARRCSPARTRRRSAATASRSRTRANGTCAWGATPPRRSHHSRASSVPRTAGCAPTATTRTMRPRCGGRSRSIRMPTRLRPRRRCPSSPADAAAARITAAGGLCVAVRGEAPDVDAALRRSTPLVATTQLGAGPRRALTDGDAAAPLRGIRILDLTRVIAGPVCTRTLALLGADVLRIDSPRLPEIPWQHLDTGHGKRSALLDLEDDADRGRFEALLSSADAIVLGYRPAGLDRLGLSPGGAGAAASGSHRRAAVGVGRTGSAGIRQPRAGRDRHRDDRGARRRHPGRPPRPGTRPQCRLPPRGGGDGAPREARRRGRLLVRRDVAAARRRGTARDAAHRRTRAVRADRPEPHLQTFDVAGTLVTTTAPAIGYEGGPTQFAAPHPWGSDEPVWRAE